MSDTPKIDFQALENYMAGETELFLQLAGDLKSTYGTHLDSLKDAISTKDCKNIELYAHTLKGLFRNFFLKDLEKLCYTIEQMGKKDAIEDSINETLSKLENEIPATLDELIIR